MTRHFVSGDKSEALRQPAAHALAQQKADKTPVARPRSTHSDVAPITKIAQYGSCACGGGCPRCRAQANASSSLATQASDAATESPSVGGLPAPLQGGLETLSGFDLSHLQVHRNSSKPARFNALAYTQGREIFVAPNQERHLPHEAWHAVQQMQGRVQPTAQLNGEAINDHAALEREADTMGAQVLRMMTADRVDDAANLRPRARIATPAPHRARPPLQRQVAGSGTTVTAQSTGNCSVAHGSELSAAAVLAGQWLRTAIQALHRYEALPLSDTTASTRAALQFHFHTTNPFHAALVRSRLAQVRDGLDSPGGAPSDCAPAGDVSCGDTTTAYYQRGRISWCPNFFGRGAIRQAKSIVHEYTHAEARRLPLAAGYAELPDCTPRRINDRAYIDRRYYLDLSPEEAFDNADSFSNLVADLGTGSPITQSPTERAQDTMAGCAPGAQETIRQSLSMSARWNDGARDMLSLDPTTAPTWSRMVDGAITANFGLSPPTRATLSAIYDAAATPLILGMALACDAARGSCQSSAVRLWQVGMRGAIHVCPGWIAEGDALSRHRLLYESVLSNVVRLPGNPWRYVDLARDLEARADLDRPSPSLPSDPFPRSAEPGTAIG